MLVSSLCILASQSASSPARGSRPLPSLLSGVAIRRGTLALNDLHLLQPSTSTAAAAAEEVQALNQVNQALSGSSSPQIIPSEKTKPTNPFVPYLLVHDVSQSAGKSVRDKPHARKEHTHHMSNSISASSTVGNSYPLHSISISSSQQQPQGQPYAPQMYGFAHQNSFPPDALLDEEAEVQLVGMSSPSTIDGGISGIKFGGTSGIKFGSVTMESTKSKQTPKPTPVKPQSTTSEPVSKVSDKEGSIVQCLELPPCVDSYQYVHSITPTLDKKYVLVVTAPKCLNRKIHQASTNQTEGPIIEEEEEEDETTEVKFGKDDKPGCLIIYQVDTSGSLCKLKEDPIQVLELQDSVVEALMLPKELSHSMDEEEGISSASSASASAAPSPQEAEVTEDRTPAHGKTIEGYVALTTYSGNVEVRRLTDFALLATIKATDDDKIISAAYCGSK